MFTVVIIQNGVANKAIQVTEDDGVNTYKDMFTRYGLPTEGVTLRSGSRQLELNSPLVAMDHTVMITKNTSSSR